MFDVWFHSIPRYVGSCHQTLIKQFYNHPLLPCNPCHSTMNAIEFTFCHNDIITKFKLDAVGSDGDDVRILNGGEADEVVHGFISYFEWWIAVGIVLKMDGMVKVVAEQGLAFICHNLVVVEQSFSLLCCRMEKNKRGEEWAGDDSLLALFPYLFILQRNITFESFSLYKDLCFVNASIRNS